MVLLGIAIDRTQVRVSLLDATTAKRIGEITTARNFIIEDHRTAVFTDLVFQDILQACQRAIREILVLTQINPSSIIAFGLTYPNEGLVLLNERKELIYHSETDAPGFDIHTSSFPTPEIAEQYFGEHLLNMPVNSLMGRLAYIYREHPALLERANHLVLPGDYTCYLLTGELHSTIADLSYAACWDFRSHDIAKTLVRHFGYESTILPKTKHSCGWQGNLLSAIAQSWDVPENLPLTYRAGEYLNHALSLQVLRPFEVAIRLGERGALYTVKDKSGADSSGRIISLAHINHTTDHPSYGQVLPILEGTDFSEPAAWNNSDHFDTAAMAEQTAIHQSVFFQQYREGWKLLKKKGLIPSVLRAPNQYLFQQSSFCSMVADQLNVTIEIIDTSASDAAALAAGVGAGYYAHHRASFTKVKPVAIYVPSTWQPLNEEPEIKHKKTVITSFI